MDWTNTNETTPVSRPRYTPPKRNPWSTIPYLMNEFNKSIDIWINTPQKSIKSTFGIPLPSANVNATNYMNHPVSYKYLDLRNLTINSTFYYPI